MNYEFVAQSMLIFTVTLASGLVKDIEFDETGKGVYGFQTSQKEVAEAIRRHPLVRSGRIIDKSQPEEEQVAKAVEKKKQDRNVLRFDNITKAKNYLAKTFGVDTRKLKSPQSVKDEASKNGIEIDF